MEVLPNLLIMVRSGCFVAERVVHYSMNISDHERVIFKTENTVSFKSLRIAVLFFIQLTRPDNRLIV